MRLRFATVAAIALLNACAHRRPGTLPGQLVRHDPSYHDLTAGETLLVVVPDLIPGEKQKAVVSVSGHEMTFMVNAISGYTISKYHVEKAAGARVTLRFESASITKAGDTTTQKTPPALPFSLPRNAAHIRLLYLIRSSSADHNMAILAAAKRESLDPFTRALKQNPETCAARATVFCVWVPLGVAVRSESNANK